MKNGSRSPELMAIPIVVVLLGIVFVLFIASEQGVWAWLVVGAAGLVVIGILIARFSRRNPHPVAATPPPAVVAQPLSADAVYRVLVIADESCVDPGFSATLADHAAGRKVEALVIAPAIGSKLARWTGDESQFVDARKHLDETVGALAAAGIKAIGETGADDPLQAADDGLREFAANEIVFVTKDGTATDWVEHGVIAAAKSRYSVPVTHIALPAA